MNIKTMRHFFLLAALATLLSGCLSVYQAEIQQGNVVTQEMIDKLKPGMTRSQVRFVLGTPLVSDPFHQDRWDYYYYLRRANEDIGEAQRLTVIFNNDVLQKVKGDTQIKNGNPKAEKSGGKSPRIKAAPATDAATQPDSARWRML